jgi:hypothetical protein
MLTLSTIATAAGATLTAAAATTAVDEDETQCCADMGHCAHAAAGAAAAAAAAAAGASAATVAPAIADAQSDSDMTVDEHDDMPPGFAVPPAPPAARTLHDYYGNALVSARAAVAVHAAASAAPAAARARTTGGTADVATRCCPQTGRCPCPSAGPFMMCAAATTCGAAGAAAAAPHAHGTADATAAGAAGAGAAAAAPHARGTADAPTTGAAGAGAAAAVAAPTLVGALPRRARARAGACRKEVTSRGTGWVGINEIGGLRTRSRFRAVIKQASKPIWTVAAATVEEALALRNAELDARGLFPTKRRNAIAACFVCDGPAHTGLGILESCPMLQGRDDARTILATCTRIRDMRCAPGA